MRNLVMSTIAAVSIAALSAAAGAQQQQQTDSPTDTSATGPHVDTGDQLSPPHTADTSATTSSTWSTSDSSAPASTTTGAGASVDFQGAEAAPAPPASYPICKGKIQDECVNPREAGLNYGNRPLKYWPGHPASQ